MTEPTEPTDPPVEEPPVPPKPKEIKIVCAICGDEVKMNGRTGVYRHVGGVPEDEHSPVPRAA
jgi:hypothetical protein